MTTSRAVSAVLSSGSPAKAIAEKMFSHQSVDQRFSWLEQLRQAALLKVQEKAQVDQFRTTSNVAALFNEESIAMQRQFEVLDRGINTSLEVEGRTSSYYNWTSVEDHDLPANPIDLADEREAYKYALKRLYRRQFEVTMNEIKTGCWPLLLVDAMEPLDGKRVLAITSAPLAVSNHSSAEYLRAMSSTAIGGYVNVFRDAQAALARRLASLEDGNTPLALVPMNSGAVVAISAAIAALASAIDVGYKIYRDVQDREVKEKEAREAKEAAAREKAVREAKAAQERAEKAMRDWIRDAKEIPGSSDHVDSFERNGDRIKGMC
jgi:hypothetical protein